MNRREVITIIVIVNFVLLSILFVTGEHTESIPPQKAVLSEATAIVQAQLQPALVTPLLLPPEPPPEVAFDEVDAVLRDFAAAVALTQTKQSDCGTTADQNVEVIVKKGDFLERIARQHRVSVEELKKHNALSSDHLKIGQVLRIPKHFDVPPPTKPQEGEYYQVHSGDNPWKIAKQYHLNLDDFLRLNQLDQESARNLKPGDVVRVR